MAFVVPPEGSNGQSAQEAGPVETVRQFQRRFQAILDRSTPFVLYRWLVWAFLLLLYIVRVFTLEGFYIVTYALGIYNLNLLLGFLTPQVDPELEGPTLPSKSDEEFRPFVRKLPEFKAWYASIRSLLLGFGATFFAAFDIPVFWPILVLYFFVLFFVTMKKQIMHMLKYRYVPFSWGKKTYNGKGGKPVAK